MHQDMFPVMTPCYEGLVNGNMPWLCTHHLRPWGQWSAKLYGAFCFVKDLEREYRSGEVFVEIRGFLMSLVPVLT